MAAGVLTVMIVPSLATVLQRHATARPASLAIAVEDGSQSLTYADLVREATSLAWQLRAAGVQPADHVVLVMDNHWSMLPLLVASCINQSVLIPLSPQLHRTTLRHILKEVHPRLIIHMGATPPDGAKPAVCRELAVFLAAAAAGAPPLTGPEATASDDPRLIIYTSGTSGLPKGVVLTETNLMADAGGIAETYGIGPDDRLLCVMPMYHMNGLMITGLVPLVGGATTIVGERFRSQTARAYIEKLAALQITVMSVIPSIMAVLTRIVAPTDLAGVGIRFGLCGTAPLGEALWGQFEQHFHIPVYQGYGLTETTCWATMTPPAGPHRLDTVGVPVNCEVRIDPRGEVLLRGPILLHGYFGKASPLDDGWFRTGDLGRVDPDGHLVITGRKKDTIIRYGMNIQPSEIDRVLVHHPAVAECATVGAPDPIAGETVHSAWTLRKQADPPSDQDLRTWLRERLSEATMPDRLHRLARLPSNDIGKVDGNRLRDIVSGALAKRIVAALDTRKWVRYKLNESLQLLRVIQGAIVAGAPIRFVKYWGAGNKTAMEDVDRSALDRVRDFLDLVHAQYEHGTELTLIFTDVHFDLNGFDRAITDPYVASITAYAHAKGFRTVRSSELWRQSGLTMAEVTAQADSPGALAEWAQLEFREELVAQAAKHGHDHDADRLARIYYRANLAESAVFTDMFANHVFLTYNRESQEQLLPRLPTIYIHSYKPQISEKPWFVYRSSQAS